MTRRSVESAAISLGITIVLDQWSKYLSKTVSLNTGISFGLLSGSELTLLLIFTLGFIAWRWGKEFITQSPPAAGIFFGGSVSNIIDRISFGGVRDFLPIPLTGIRNNLADWCIILSLLWIFYKSRPVRLVDQ